MAEFDAVMYDLAKVIAHFERHPRSTFHADLPQNLVLHGSSFLGSVFWYQFHFNPIAGFSLNTGKRGRTMFL